MLWVQLPPGPLVIVLVERPGVLATLSRWRSWVRIPPGTLLGTVRKPAKRPSSNLGDRLWVRFPPVRLIGQVVELADTRRSDRRAVTGVGVRLSPWSLRSGLESGFHHGLISPSTPVQIRPPHLVPWSSGEDSWPTSRQRWFESIRDQCRGQKSEVRGHGILTSDL